RAFCTALPMMAGCSTSCSIVVRMARSSASIGASMTSPLDQALVSICTDLLEEGAIVYPRGLETREVVSYRFRLDNPRARETTLPPRRWNKAFAIGELCWHMAGSNSVDFIAYYSKNWSSFSDDGEHIRGSCYGKKIFGKTDGGISGWER